MTDLQKRLRAKVAEPLQEGDLPVFNQEWSLVRLCHEAADEIERLREALQFIADNWRDANVNMDAFYWKARAALGEGK